MKKNYLLNLLVCCILFSCGSDDSSITPVSIETQPDSVSLSQNSQIEIFIFANDSNIPEDGQLTISTPQNGTVTINNTSSPLNTQSIIYTTNPNVVGTEELQYTVCDNNNNCETESISITITTLSEVTMFTGETPFNTLSEYNFFEGDLKDLSPTFGVLPYETITPLFTDYAHKKRFIWMPNGVKANYVDDYSNLNFPVGTVIIKSFFYENTAPSNSTYIIETRLMYRKTDGWDFAQYVWNDEQTEAYYSEDGGFINMTWTEDGNTLNTNYRIPSRAECFTCHHQDTAEKPIGVKPQNLNKDYAFSDGISNQLSKLIEVGYLENNLPANIDTVVNWDDDSNSLESRARSYLDINCAHCHTDGGHCDYRPMRFAYQDTYDPYNLGICVDPDTPLIPNSKIVMPGDSDNSMLYYRISTTSESARMPLLGRTINHAEGINLIRAWINSLTDHCN